MRNLMWEELFLLTMNLHHASDIISVFINSF